MASRLTRGLTQVNRHVSTRLSARAVPRLATVSARAGLLAHRNTRNVAPWTCRVKQANPTRYAHTESASPGGQEVGILDATGYKGSTITEKHWVEQDVGVVDGLIEPQSVLHFVEFITSGILPNGKKTDLALLNADEFALFMAPSSQWAPAPFNKEDLPIVQKAVQRITGPVDLAGVCRIGHNIHFLKRRLWGGLAPIPASRWREKDLSNPEHFAIAYEHLTSVIAVFEYLNLAQIRTNMCTTFNKISGDFGEMQEALNARRKFHGVSGEVDLTALWEEFIRAQYEVMTSTAHSWVMAQVTELRERALDSFNGLKTEDPNTPKMVEFTKRWTDLINITSMADFNIWMSMEGYNGFRTPSEVVAGLYNPDLKNQDKNYGFSKLLMDRLKECIEAQNEAAKTQGPSAIESEAARRERVSISSVVQDELREKIRGRTPSPQPPVQPWIQQLLRAQEASLSLDPAEREDYGFGLAVYRASHVSDEKWEQVQRNMEAHFSTWSDGVQGATELKPSLKLHWFNGIELGFDPIQPVHAARKHYQEIRSSDEWSHKLAPSVFLLVDHLGIGSYTDDTFGATFSKSKGFLEGDFKGQVLAVDPDFEESATPTASGNETAKQDTQEAAPEYNGRTRILGNLVWSELYPMLMLQSVGLEHFWLQARDHPLKVYTGPTVPSQVQEWKEHNGLKTVMMDSFVEFLKEKDPSLAGKVEVMRKEGSLS